MRVISRQLVLSVATKFFCVLVIAILLLAPLHLNTSGGEGLVSLSVASAVTTYTKASCSLDPGTWDLCITNIIYVFTVGLMSVFAYIGVYFFDMVVQIALSGPTYALDFVSQGWTLVRDLANMAFLFVLIYVAFTVMFRAETSGTMQTLAAVIVVALLVNFSFFLTRVVVDTGNILATQFYNAIDAPLLSSMNSASNISPTIANSLSTLTKTGQTKDLAGNIMNALKVQNILNTDSFSAWYKSQERLGGFATVLITLSMVYVAVGAAFAILAFTFLTVGFKFLMRIVVLWFLIIAAPLAFVARALQGMRKDISGMYHKWLDALLRFSFYPAIFLFMFWVVNVFVKSMNVGQGTLIDGIFSNLRNTRTNEGDFIMPLIGIIANIAIRLGFVIGMLWLALRASDMIVAEGTSFARGFASKMTLGLGDLRGYGRFLGRGLGYASGGGAYLARQSVGRGAYAASRSELVQGMASRNLFGRALKGGLEATASSRLDVRGLPGLQQALGAAGVKVAPSTVGKGGFVAQVEKRQKALKKAAEGLKGDAVDIQKAQQEFANQYDADNGPGSYSSRVEELTKKRNAARNETERKEVEKELNPLQNAGKEAIKLRDKEFVETFSKRLSTPSWQNLGNPSPGSVRGAADMLKEKGVKEAAKELQKKIVEEEGEEPEPPEDGPGAGGGGSGHSPSSGSSGGGSGGASGGSGPASTGGHTASAAPGRPILSTERDSEEVKLLRRLVSATEQTAKVAQTLATTAPQVKTIAPNKETVNVAQKLAEHSAANDNTVLPPVANDNIPPQDKKKAA